MVEYISTLMVKSGHAARFLRDMETLRALSPPSLLTIHHASRDEAGELYLVTAPFEGTMLDTLLTSAKRVPPHRAAWIVCDVLDGLSTLHEAGVAHGGLITRRIGLLTTDDGERAVLMPPMLEGGIPATDLLDAAAVLYELLYGTAPSSHPSLPSADELTLPIAFEQLLMRALKGRFSRAAELRQALSLVAEEATLTGTMTLMSADDMPDDPGPIPVSSKSFAVTTAAADDETRRLVMRVFGTIGRAFRNFAIYPEDNPMFQMSANDACRALDEVFAAREELSVLIDRFSIRYLGDVVYEEPDAQSSFPFRLYQDGVRRLIFKSGIPKEEMVEYLVCLHRVTAGAGTSGDVVTVMWERAFPHISMHLVEDLVAEEGNDVAMLAAAEIATAEDAAWHGVVSEGEAPANAPVVPHARRPEVDTWLPAGQRARLALMRRSDEQADRLSDLLQILMGAVPVFAGEVEQMGLMRMLKNTLRAVILRRDFVRTTMILVGARRLLRSNHRDALSTDLDDLIASASKPDPVEHLMSAMASTESDEERQQIAHILSLLAPDATAGIVDWLDRLPPDRASQVQLSLMMMCKQYPWRLSPGLRHDREAVVIASIRVLREIRGTASRNELRPLLAHAAPAVRAAALAALVHQRDPDLANHVTGLRDDLEQPVRDAVLDACRALTPEAAAETLRHLFERPDLPTRPRSELVTLFELMVANGRDELVEALGARLMPQHRSGLRARARDLATRVMGGPKDDSLMAPMARALALIQTPAARNQVARIVSRGETKTRQAIEHALANHPPRSREES